MYVPCFIGEPPSAACQAGLVICRYTYVGKPQKSNQTNICTRTYSRIYTSTMISVMYVRMYI